MVIGMMFSGIVAGMGGLLLSLLAGHPVLIALLMYPAAGLVGVLLFLAFALGFAPSLRIPGALAAGSAETRHN